MQSMQSFDVPCPFLSFIISIAREFVLRAILIDTETPRIIVKIFGGGWWETKGFGGKLPPVPPSTALTTYTYIVKLAGVQNIHYLIAYQGSIQLWGAPPSPQKGKKVYPPLPSLCVHYYIGAYSNSPKPKFLARTMLMLYGESACTT